MPGLQRYGPKVTPRASVKILEEHGRKFRILRDYAADPRAALLRAVQMLDEGFVEPWHPWAVKVQKSSQGRRASVEVTFRENRPSG
jgi:hypothetical protein